MTLQAVFFFALLMQVKHSYNVAKLRKASPKLLLGIEVSANDVFALGDRLF
jgi:hypothetical protein